MATPIESPGGTKSKSKSKAGILDLVFNIDPITGGELPLYLIYRISFVAFLIFIYIYYTMLADGEIHQIAKIKTELQEVRADYTTQKAEYMKASKQSYLATEMKKYNLQMSLTPPIKVVSEEEIEK
jgi:hypothetical protein